MSLGQHIADPRMLSDELGNDDSDPDMYSGLASYTFGSSRPTSLSSYDAVSETSESISPLTVIPPRLSPDRTPRSSVSGQSTHQNVSSHPSQGAGRPASSLYQSRRNFATRDTLPLDPSSSRVVSRSHTERSQDPTSSTDPINVAYFSPQRAHVMSDNASQHTFGPATRTHGVAAASSRDVPSSSSVSVTTSRSSSRASMNTLEQFSSDDELDEIDYSDGDSSPVTFARDLVDIDEDADLVHPPPPRSSILDRRRGSSPVPIPGAVQPGDAYSTRSREGSILTVRRFSRSCDAASARRSSYSGEDRTVILPKSEPHSRADYLSVEVQRQVMQHQTAAPNVWDGFNLDYILLKHSEGSIRSVGSRLSFVHRRSTPHISGIPITPGSTTTLPIEDSFERHLQTNIRSFDTLRFYWSFQREKADASNSSSRRRQQINHHRNEKSGKETSSKVQELWRCGHVGRFKVDKLVLKPQSSDPTKSTQQRINIRHIPDPFVSANPTTGPNSVIHKHSRAVAFSIFRSHSLFSRQPGGTGAGPSTSQTHMNTRFGIMLAPRKVQEQYTSTKSTRQLETHGLLDNESRGAREKDREKGRRGGQSVSNRERDSSDRERRRAQEKEDKGKSKIKTSSKGKSKDKSKHRLNPTESTESSTATSSAGSITNSKIQHMVSPALKIQFSPSTSSSTLYKHDSLSRPSSPTSLLPPSVTDSTKIPGSESSSLIPPTRYHRDHRDSIDSDDRLPVRTTHAEAFSALDPNDIENLRAKASSRVGADSGSTLNRLLRAFRGSSRTDDHYTSSTQPRAFHPPWLTTAGRDQQEENDRVLNDLNASFRDVGLLHTNPHKSSKAISKRKASQGILDQIPDDCLYMLLPLWPGESDTKSVHAETSSAASIISANPESRHFLLVYYVPFGKATVENKKTEKKKAKQSHSSDSGVETDVKAVYLPTFRVVARVVTYAELRFTGVRVPSDGLAISGPEWEALNYSVFPQDAQMTDVVVCHCESRERGFDFLEDGLFKLGLCTRDELDLSEEQAEFEEREVKTMLTPIGKAVVEMIWLGCLAITSFGST